MVTAAQLGSGSHCLSAQQEVGDIVCELQLQLMSGIGGFHTAQKFILFMSSVPC